MSVQRWLHSFCDDVRGYVGPAVVLMRRRGDVTSPVAYLRLSLPCSFLSSSYHTYLVRPQQSTLGYEHFQMSPEEARTHNIKEDVRTTHELTSTLRAVIWVYKNTVHEPVLVHATVNGVPYKNRKRSSAEIRGRLLEFPTSCAAPHPSGLLLS